MAYIIDIATAVPQYSVSNTELIDFYVRALGNSVSESVLRKLNILTEKTKIIKRHSCIPDFNGELQELFKDGNYNQSVERRTEVYKERLLPLAVSAIDKLFRQTNTTPKVVTHLITVSCTGIFAPGFEFMVAEHYGMRETEKLGINFLGCYAAVKALKHANYIANAVPSACVMIVCAELCSLHFTPSVSDEDILSNLLFADGSAAALVVGNENELLRDKSVLSIDAVSSAFIPHTLDLMTWNISSVAFRMYLSKNIVDAIGDNIFNAVNNFLTSQSCAPDYWAIHPGGVRIVEVVRQSIGLSESDVWDSLNVLEEYGNMSSPTILFVLQRIMNKIRDKESELNKNIFACAFGPGLNVEMLKLSLVHTSNIGQFQTKSLDYAIQV